VLGQKVLSTEIPVDYGRFVWDASDALSRYAAQGDSQQLAYYAFAGLSTWQTWKTFSDSAVYSAYSQNK